MKETTPENNLSAHLKKGNFVDIMMAQRLEWQIIDIIELKIYVRTLRQQNTKINVDINSSKIRPFRVVSRPSDIVSFTHKHYCYWGEGFTWALQTLKKINQSDDLYGGMSAIDIVQFWKGKNYLIVMSMNDRNKITEQILVKLAEYSDQFMKFFLKYWKKFDVRGLTQENLYDSQISALTLSYPEIIINFSVLFCRRIYLDLTMGRKLQKQGQMAQGQQYDRIMISQLQWLKQKFIPQLINQTDLSHFNFEIIVKICSLLGKLAKQTGQSRLQLTRQCSQKLFTKLIRSITSATNPNTLGVYYEQLKHINQLFLIFPCNEIQHYEMLKCKLNFLSYLQILYKLYVGQNNEKTVTLVKNMGFVLSCLDSYRTEEMYQLVQKYLDAKFGMDFFVKNCQFSLHISQLTKLAKNFPNLFFTEVIKGKRTEVLKLPNMWTPKLLVCLLNVYLANNTTIQKDDLIFSVNIHKIVYSQINFINNASKANASSIFQGRTQEQVQIQMKALVENLSKLQSRIIHLCQILCDAMDKTMTIEYIQKNILEKYIIVEHNTINSKMSLSQTNNFQQNYIFKHYINKLSHLNKEPNLYKVSLYETFLKLCKGIIFLKSKSQLQSRKENLIFLLNKLCHHCPTDIPQLIRIYAENVRIVQNREFRNKALQFVVTMFNRPNLFKSPEEKVQAEKLILSAIKIEGLTQMRIFFELFKSINHRENNLRLVDEFNLPLIIFKRPFGLTKLYEAFSCGNDKLFVKKLVQFFTKIQNKIADETLKKQIISQTADKLLECIIKTVEKQQLFKADQDFIVQMVSLLQSLLFYEVHSSSAMQYEYSRIFIERNSNSMGHLSNNLIIEEENVIDKSNRKIKIIVRIWNQRQNEQQGSENQSQYDQWNAEVQLDQRLYSIKARASSYFEMSPILSNFYVQSTMIPHLQQNKTVQKIYDQFVIQQKKDQQKEKDNKSLDDNGQMKKTQQIKRDQQQNLVLIMRLRAHHNQNIVKDRLTSQLKVVFKCLSFTQRIWTELKITAQQWLINPQLIQLKKEFLDSYPGETIIMKQHSKLTEEQKVRQSQWLSIIEEPLKKRYLFEALLNDPQVQKFRNDWLFDSFSQILNHNNKLCIENNILTLLLIEKLKPKPTQRDFIQMLAKLGMEQRDTRIVVHKDNAEIQKSYAILLNRAFTYVEINANFQIFNFMMTLKSSFYENLSEYNKKYFDQIRRLIVGSFFQYTETNFVQFLQSKMMLYLTQHTANFQFFLNILSRDPFNLADLPLHQQIFKQWLSKSILLLIEDRKYILQLNANFPMTRTILHCIECMLIRGIRTPQLYSDQFKSILNSLLQTKLCNTSVSIITILISECTKEGEYYVAYFQREMNDVEWDRKDYIKFNKNNLRHESGYVGLNNPHSICYVNSLLQQLYHIRPFRRQLYLTKWKKNDSVEEDLVFQLKKLFINLNYKQCDSYFNRNFFEAFKNDEGNATSLQLQMDVDEFRSILFDRIQNLVVKSQNQKNNFVQKNFNGKQLTIIKGKDCQHHSTREQDFSSICLEVKGLKNLGCSLQHYFKPEILNEDNKYFCEECNKKVVAQKTNVIKQYPKYLTFVLKRFQYVYQYRKKINERFQFPLDSFKMSQDNIYRLKGVIVHQGLSQAGHYFSLIKINKKWYQFNDNQITQTSEQEVANLSYGQYTLKCNRNAYLLFYERVQGLEEPIYEENLNEIIPFQFGLEQQIAQIKKYNNLVWKTDLFLSSQFEGFIDTVVKNQVKDSISLLFQYIINIRQKCFKVDLKSLRNLFELLKTYSISPLLSCDTHVDWAIKFYRNQHFNPSLKSALSDIIAAKFETLDANAQMFLKVCLVSIHDEIQTSPFYYLFYVLCKANPQVMKFLVSHRIIGRIFDISFPNILLKLERQTLSQTTQVQFNLIEDHKLQKKRSVENSELRYHKWVLINYIVESNIQLHRIQQSYLYNWSAIKCQHIFEEASHKATINQISKFFAILSTKNSVFSNSYLVQVCEQLAKDKSELLRKYLKAAFDLLAINDAHRPQRIRSIKKAFSDTFLKLYKDRILSSFDVKWQWFIKIVYHNYHFRNCVRVCLDEFRILTSKYELQTWYSSRNEMMSEGKHKNKYYGLKFSLAAATNTTLLQQKLQKTRLIFNQETPNSKFAQIYKQQYNFDKNLINFPNLQLKPNSIIWKYVENLSKFKEITIDEAVGDVIVIHQISYDRGDQRLTYVDTQVGSGGGGDMKEEGLGKVEEQDGTVKQEEEDKMDGEVKAENAGQQDNLFR